MDLGGRGAERILPVKAGPWFHAMVLVSGEVGATGVLARGRAGGGQRSLRASGVRPKRRVRVRSIACSSACSRHESPWWHGWRLRRQPAPVLADLDPGAYGLRAPRARCRVAGAARGTGRREPRCARAVHHLSRQVSRPGRRHQPGRRARRLVARQLRHAARRLLRRESLRIALHRLPAPADRASRHRPARPAHRHGHPEAEPAPWTFAAGEHRRRSGDAGGGGLLARREAGPHPAGRSGELGGTDRSVNLRERRSLARVRRCLDTLRARGHRAEGAPGPRERPTQSRPGTSITLRARLYAFDCEELGQLTERLFAVRKALTGPTARAHTLPFSAAFAAHEARVNARFMAKQGFFALGARDSAYSIWQTGWGGGFGRRSRCWPPAESSRARARCRPSPSSSTGGQAPSGFFHGVSDGKTWYDDGFTAPLPPAPTEAWPPRAPPYHHPRWHLVRRSADALALLVKQLALLDRQALTGSAGAEQRTAAGRSGVGDLGPELRRRAGASVGTASAVRTVRRRRQRRADRRRLVIGRDGAGRPGARRRVLQGATLPADRRGVGAALLRALRAGGPHLRRPGRRAPVSRQRIGGRAAGILRHALRSDARSGVDRAGPGSGASARQLGHLVRRAAGRPWLPAGGPIRATGAVFSDAQNRAGAPGYVLSSGSALFRLYRATGDVALLELLRDTAHNLAQYLPLVDDAARPARAGGA